MPRAKKTPAKDVKEEKKVAAPVAEAVEEQAAEKKEPAKRGRKPKAAETSKAAAKPAAKKTAAKEVEEKDTAVKKDAPALKADVFIQFSGNEYSESDIMEKVVAAWEAEGKKVSAIKRTKLYIKPEEGKAYYVINEGLKNGTMGAIDL